MTLQRAALFEGLIDLVENIGDRFNFLSHLRRCLALYGKVTDQQQQRLHPCQVPHGFPAHRLVDVKQHPIPACKAGVLGNG